MLDMVIRGGTVVDGSGMAGFRGDVAIEGGSIVEVGRVTERGRREIDADGQVVTPGFIDGHTHMDAQVMWDPIGSCSCYHGVTSVVMGNCGFTLAPAAAERRELVVRNLERAEDISAEALREGIDWTWDSFAGYLGAVDGRPKAINYSGYVGHSALRTWAMGERAFSELATDEDLSRMEIGLAQSLRAGAIGMSTSRSDQHETSDDRPVASRVASWDEVRRLVCAMGALGGGVFEIAQEAAARSSDPEERRDFHDRMRGLAIDSGALVTFGVIAASKEPEPWRDLLGALDATAAAGGRMIGQTHSRGITSVLSFLTKLPFDRLPEWTEVRRLPLEGQRAAFTDTEVRHRLVRSAHEADYGRAIGAEARAPDFDAIQILDRGLPPHRLLAKEAASQGVDPVELMLDLALDSDFQQLFLQPISWTGEDEVLEILRHPRTVMTFSDSGAHVSQIMDSSITTHLLGYWVRDRKAFTLEHAIQMITLAPAVTWGFADRGLIRPGMVADINVFDPNTITPAVPEVVADLPGGGRRLVQKAAGMRATLVAGQLTMEDGEPTGALPGRLLRGPFYRP
jgi:N-acyl-D-amino-acid deacylase